jgi:hypothetical protein
MWSEDEADDRKPTHPLPRSTAWWISQSQLQGARFWTGTYAEGRGVEATACSRNDRYGMSDSIGSTGYSK